MSPHFPFASFQLQL
jgi:hypothetical protein